MRKDESDCGLDVPTAPAKLVTAVGAQVAPEVFQKVRGVNSRTDAKVKRIRITTALVINAKDGKRRKSNVVSVCYEALDELATNHE